MKSSLYGRTGPLRPISAALLSIFGLLPLESMAAPAVTNCDDGGPGSLRQSVLEAADPDTVDLTQLNCTITLTTGAIIIGQDQLVINGPGADKLTIDGSQNKPGYNIFLHAGHEGLEIHGMAIRHSTFYFNNAHKYLGGGCIFSSSSVGLYDSIVSDCKIVTGPDSAARGGAVAANEIFVLNSVISGNRVYHGPSSGTGLGGALYAKDQIRIYHSTIADNTAPSIAGGQAPNLVGGGLYTKGVVTVAYSTISGNAAASAAALSCGESLTIEGSTISGNRGYSQGAIVTTNAVQAAWITNSTISGNTALAPGLFVSTTPAMTLAGPTDISNSTIAFNIGQGSRAAVSVYGNIFNDNPLKMYSSIFADNFPADVYVDSRSFLAGAYNLIVTTSAPLPPVTITSCPKLEALANNSGPTLTHALQHASPAIDAGLNLLALPYDQRWQGFPRKYGPRPDIGAIEWRGGPDNEIFHSGFNFPAGFCELR